MKEFHHENRGFCGVVGRSEARCSESGVWSWKSEKFGRRVDDLLSVLRLDLGLRSDREETN